MAFVTGLVWLADCAGRRLSRRLLSDSVDAAAKARNQGVKVRLSVYEGMFHVFQMGYLNFPESKRAWAEVKRFLKVIKEEE